MKKILLHNPAIASLNMGDHIIADSAKTQLHQLLNENFVAEISTHLPTSFYYMRLLDDWDYSFVLGSNLLKSTFFGLKRQWDVKYSQFYLNPVTLIGVGWWQYGNKPNLYTKILYNKLLDKNVLHSVRDNYTLNVLKDMGIKNVLNTSCSTMWKFTEEYNTLIPEYKSKDVLFTLTDYNKNEIYDRKLINLLTSNYSNVYFWPQGVEDLKYVNELFKSTDKKLKVISPSLEDYDRILNSKEIDFIGTRLHGGIRALQNKKRTLILSVDNRAEEKKRDFNLPVVSRENIEDITRFINGKYETNIVTPQKEIIKWKEQFGLS